MPEPAGSITQFFEELRAGNRAAATPLCERFLPRLIALANKTLAGRPQRVADAEDAVQAALIDFWTQIERGQIQGEQRRENLWNLLGLMTVRRALKQVRQEAAKKRGGCTVLDGVLVADNESPRIDAALAVVPTHEFDLYCEELLLQLDEDLRPFIVLRLLGYSTAEIAETVDCTQRKVQRKLDLVRLKWQRELTGEGGS